MSLTLDKGLMLLACVADGHGTLSELCLASGLPKSTAHRLLKTLVSRGLLRYHDQQYLLGYKLLEYGGQARRQLRYPVVAYRHLEATSLETSETVHLGELDGQHIVYLEKIDGRRGLQMVSYVGLRVPAQTTALGKVLISYRPPDQWASYLMELPPRTVQTITNKGVLIQELAEIRRQGYALDREENEPGIRCVAAPVWDDSGRVVAAVSISGATIYISEERQLELVPVLLDCARKISRDLGGGDTPPFAASSVASPFAEEG